MVSWLVRSSRIEHSGFEPWLGTYCVVFLGKTLNSHGWPLSTQVYKWVPANLLLEGNPVID